jgi:hypothetical protein
MTTVTAVTEHVHRDKGDSDQHPEPVSRKPCHNSFSFGFALAPPVSEEGSGDKTLLQRVLIAAAVLLKGRLRAAGMFLDALMLGHRERAFGLAHFVCRAVGDDDELTGFDLRLVLDDAVFGKPDAVQTCA